MEALTKRALQLHLAVVAALAGLGVVMTAESEAEAVKLAEALAFETMAQCVVNVATSTLRHVRFHSGGSITIAARGGSEPPLLPALPPGCNRRQVPSPQVLV